MRILLVHGSAELALLLSLRLISQVATVRWEGFGGFATDARMIAIGDEIHCFFTTVYIPYEGTAVAALNNIL